MNRRNRSRTRAILSSPVILVAAIVLLIFLGRAAAGIYSKSAESSAHLEEAQSSLEKMEASETNLKSQIDSLSTPAGIEASVRERYHAVEPGESVVVIVDDKPATSAGSASSSTENVAIRSWWQRILQAIGL